MSTPSTPGTFAPPAGRASPPPPDQGALLAALDAKLDRIEARLAKLDPLLPLFAAVGDAPGAVAMVGDGFDEFARELGNLDERLRAALALLERVTRPETLGQLHAALDLLESLPGVVAMVGDGVDELARAAAARGLSLDALVPELGRVLEQALGHVADGTLAQLLDSGLLDPKAIAVLGGVARAMAQSAADATPSRRAGLLALLSAAREPEVQQTLALTLDFARRFGAQPSSIFSLSKGS